jgi:hypothetical protein
MAGRVGNSDNRANSAQVQMNLPTRAELGKNKTMMNWTTFSEREKVSHAASDTCLFYQ